MLAARGTSDNAAQFGRYLLEITTGIPVSLAAPSIATIYKAEIDYSDALVVATSFAAVRFGNVLNSSGSVIPTFRRQIERGGPVTVTHPEMTRFFMTIPEAVSLVVQAGAIGGRGQIFVLDMGDPVKIVDLAANMIRLSGHDPRLPGDETPGPRDVRITFVGSRPGEKIHEQLWSGDEAVGETTHPKIKRLSRPPVDAAWLGHELRELERLADEGDTLEVVAKLGAIVREPKRETVQAPEPTLDADLRELAERRQQ